VISRPRGGSHDWLRQTLQSFETTVFDISQMTSRPRGGSHDWVRQTPQRFEIVILESIIKHIILDVGLLLHARARTNLKYRTLCLREIDLTDLHSLRSYSKYLTTRPRHIQIFKIIYYISNFFSNKTNHNKNMIFLKIF
jgi:hypothetical protein